MSSLSKLTSAPTFCLTNSPSSSKRNIPPPQPPLLTKSGFQSLTQLVKVDPLSTAQGNARGCRLSSISFPEVLLPWSSFRVSFPVYPWPAFCFLIALFLLHASHATHRDSQDPFLSCDSKCFSSFALRTTGCQVQAAVLSALVKESR